MGAMRLALALAFALATYACGAACPHVVKPDALRGAPRRVLFFTESTLYFKLIRHPSLEDAVAALYGLGAEEGFDVDCADEARAVLTRENLARHGAVAFYTAGELRIDAEQRATLLDFVRRGGAYIGFHSATDTAHEWPEHADLIGARFEKHPWNQEVTVRVEDAAHPVAAGLPATFRVHEEVYVFDVFHAESNHVLLALDPASVKIDEAPPWGHPLAWTRRFGEGHVFYSAFGHWGAVWKDAHHLQLLRNGIRWALAR
jgi:hypothetical protein